ncbi:VCBS domain-containing protein [Microvirga subterranea]|uniref:VCBS repeat-containing protein n=1 Tax=Microvirga subterranea TaxID=186651 RepID=A0A370HRQ8_9HYPH|nr:VCBS domain-containing protein [Microvirga subterranea]RDI60975.1 VCBS repeat-containing protein [Microvirga subterranea]
MSLTTFNEFLLAKQISFTSGGEPVLTQSQFSTYYTAWLTSIFSDPAVQQWLRDNYKIDLAGKAIQVNLNQNSDTLLPTVNGITDQKIYDALFGEKSSLIVGTGKTTQERSYVSDFEDTALKAMFAPKVSGPVTGQATEDGTAAPLKALANITDADTKLDSLKVLYSNLPAGVTYDESTKSFVLDTSNEAYQHLAKGQTDKVSFTYIVSDGKYQTEATATWTITGTNDAPVVSGAVTGVATEDGSASTLNALANASDKDDGTVLAVVNVPVGKDLQAGVTYDAATHTFSLDPSDAAYQHLAAGQTHIVTVNYGVSDGSVTTEASVSWTITGTNDAPIVSGSVTGAANEDGLVSSLNALLNVTDKDDASVLSVVNVPAADKLPAGVTYDAVAHTFSLDPSNATYQHLAAGKTQVVTVNYGVSDGIATTDASVSWTVTGTNDAPRVSGAVNGSAFEDTAVSQLDALANASDPDDNSVLSVVNVPAAQDLPAGVTYDAATKTFTFDPSNGAYQHLAAGQKEVVVVNYGVSDGTATTGASVSWTITGTNDAPTVSGAVTGTATEDGAASTLNALAKATDKDDGAVLSVVDVPMADKLPAGVTYDAAAATFRLDPSHAAYQHLAAGQKEVVTVHYGVSDGSATTDASVSWTITGTNDAPRISDVVKGNATEDGAFSHLNALANASDPDDGSALSVVNVPATGDLPAGVSYDAATHKFGLDPSNLAFQHLAAGQEQVVTVHYGVSDGVDTTDASVSWTVTGVNDAPKSVSLDHSSVAENAAGAIIGKLSAIDPDDNDVVSFSVLKADGSGAVDNRFTVDASGNLKLAAGVSLDYEAASSINVVVRGMDNGGSFKDQAFTIAVQDVNEAPTAVQLLNKLASTPENGAAVKVADIKVIDDALGTNALSLSGADSGSFSIETNATTGAKELWFKGGADFEKKAAYDVTVNVDDPTVGVNPDAFDTFHFGITDVVEGTRVSFDKGIDGASYSENGLKVRALTSGDTLDFVAGTGSGDQDLKLHSGTNSPYEFTKDGGGTFTLLSVDLVGSEGSGGTWYAYKGATLVGSQNVSTGSTIDFSLYGDLFKDVTSVKWETVNDNQNANQSQTIDNLWFI